MGRTVRSIDPLIVSTLRVGGDFVAPMLEGHVPAEVLAAPVHPG
jgi:hypothetical protein